MILGIGTDIVSISRIEDIYKRHDVRFLARCFTDAERVLIGDDSAAIARRYAAKEAAAKAFGTGIGKDISFHDLEVLKAQSGAPLLQISAHARDFLAQKHGIDGSAIKTHISLSDDPPYAVAYVVFEA